MARPGRWRESEGGENDGQGAIERPTTTATKRASERTSIDALCRFSTASFPPFCLSAAAAEWDHVAARRSGVVVLHGATEERALSGASWRSF